MQRTNLIAFIVLAAFVLGGWYLLMQSTKDPEADKETKVAKKEEKPEKKPETKPEKKEEKPEPPKEKKAPEPEKKVPAKVPAAKIVKLGGAGFHLTVDTINRGAGISRVVLNRFKAANWRGEPTDDDLEIIREDTHAPAFRMYHYLDSKDDNPVFGLGEEIWDLDRQKFSKDELGEQTQEVTYSTTVPGMKHIRVVKTYRLAQTDYHVTMLLELHVSPDQKAEKTLFRYQLTGAQGLPIEGEWYTATFRNAIMGLTDRNNNFFFRHLEESARISPRKGGDRFPEERSDNRLQYAGVANQYFGVMIVVDDQQPSKEDGGTTPDKILAWARPTLETTEKRGVIVKLDVDNDKMLFSDDKGILHSCTLLPRTKKHIQDLELAEKDQAVLSYYETPDGRAIATWMRIGTTLKPQFDDITVRVNSEVIELSPRDVHKHQFLLYHGPVKAALLAQFRGDKAVPEETVERYTQTLNLRTLTDYRSDNFFGKISSFIGLTWVIIKVTQFMHWVLNLLHYVFGYGFSIIVLTVMVRGAMFPISRKQALFSIKMQELAPELKKITEKYPDDPQARMQATQEFYRKHGINPLGSCWPMFLQMPIFLGLYFALQESIHFRLAEFWPLWIKNLSAPDMLFPWSEQIPIISSPDHAGGILGIFYLGPFLNILPMIAVVFMMIQQMQTMPPPTDDQQAMQQKMLKYMSIFFGIMFYKVAAGLCIYFIASSLWGMAERKLLPKKKPVSAYPDPATGRDAGGGSAGGGSKPSPNGPMSPIDKGKWGKKEKEKPKEKETLTTFDKLKALWREILKKAEKK